MDEYIERKALIESFTVNGGEITYGETMLKAIISRINSAPTADVVEVVRCKDCKHGEADYGCGGDIINPFQYRCCYDGDSWNPPEHFCSYGERKEGVEG